MVIYFNENENNDAKTIIPSNNLKHITTAMSVKFSGIPAHFIQLGQRAP